MSSRRALGAPPNLFGARTVRGWRVGKFRCGRRHDSRPSQWPTEPRHDWCERAIFGQSRKGNKSTALLRRAGIALGGAPVRGHPRRCGATYPPRTRDRSMTSTSRVAGSIEGVSGRIAGLRDFGERLCRRWQSIATQRAPRFRRRSLIEGADRQAHTPSQPEYSPVLARFP